MVRNYLLVLLGLCYWESSFCQEVNQRFRSFTVDEGLSQNSVNAIAQDKTGFIWIGTLDGLNRFDGNQFRVFGYNPDNPNSLPSTAITSLLYDSRDTLWIGTRKGLVTYSEALEQFSQIDGLDSVQLVSSIFESTSGVVWVLCDLGVYYKSVNTDFEYLEIPENIVREKTISPSNAKETTSSLGVKYRAITEASDGSIWLGTQTKGVIRYNPADGTFKRFSQTGETTNSLPDNFIFDLDSRNDLIWIATGEGLTTFDVRTNLFRIPKEIQFDSASFTNGARAIHISTDGTWWYAYDGNGLSGYLPHTKNAVNFRHSDSDPFSISSDDIKVIYEDRKGVIWLGTNNGGINRFDPNDNFFKIYKKEAGSTNGLSSYSMRKIIEDRKGFIWAATRVAGLNRVNPTTQEVISFQNDPNDSNSLAYDRVNQVLEDVDGNLWLGLVYNGLDKLEIEYGQDNSIKGFNFIHFNPEDRGPNSLAGVGVLDLLQQNDTTIWIACFGGLSRLNPKTNEIKTFRQSPIIDNIIKDENIFRAISLDNRGTLWIGTQGAGLLAFDTQSEQFKDNQVHKDDDRNSLSADVINCLLFDSVRNSLWIGTGGFGLNKYDLKSETFTRFTENDGLSNNYIYGILTDSENNIWMSTNKGINRFNPENSSVRIFRQADGLQSDEFNFASYSKARDGKLFFGGVKGFNVFQPDELDMGKAFPHVIITDLSLFGEPVRDYSDTKSPLRKSILNTETINLDYGDYIFSFDFIALDFEDPRLHRYAYKLDNFNSDWVELGNTSQVTFTNLDAGEYLFRVKAANREGNWAENSTSLNVIIHPPWWESWIFRVTLVLAGVFAIFLFFQIRTRSIKNRNRILKQEVDERTQELKESNDELKIQKEELQQTNKALKRAQGQLVKSEKKASLGILTAGISHELNNPLNYISGGVQAFKNTIPDKFLENPKVNKIIRIIEEGVFRSQNIISALSTFHSEHTTELRVCDVHDAIQQSIELLPSNLKEKSRLNMKFSSEKLEILGDGSQLSQLFQQIIKNAIQAVEQNGNVIIRTEKQSDSCVVQIQDDGKGIAQQDLSKLEDPFFTTKSPNLGKGLGLYIADYIVNEHKGSIHYDSKVGIGSTVTIKIPLLIR